MFMNLDDLNPRLVNALRQQVRELSDKSSRSHVLSKPERDAFRVLEQQADRVDELPFFARTTVPLVLSVLIVGLYASCYIDYTLSLYGAPVTMASLVWLVGWMGRRAQPAETAYYSPEVVRAVLPLALRSPGERLYYDALVLLADRDTLIDEPTRRDVLQQLNALLDSRYQIDLQRERVSRLINTYPAARVQAERDDLERRMEQTKDAVTWEALRQSAELCDTRLRGVLALDPMLRRLEAQQEMIHQALASVHLALARLQAAVLGAPVALGIADIRDTVTRVNNQTQAVEQAVAEVMALRT